MCNLGAAGARLPQMCALVPAAAQWHKSRRIPRHSSVHEMRSIALVGTHIFVYQKTAI